MSGLSTLVAKVQADIAAVESSTPMQLPATIATLKTDADALAAMVNAVVVAFTDTGVPGLTDDLKPMVVS